VVQKGGPGSGSWEGPGVPRFPKNSILEINPFKNGWDVKRTGGNYVVKDKNGVELASATVVFHQEDEMYAFSGFVKAKTAIIDTIQINDEKSRGKGQGSSLLHVIETDARKAGMLRIRATHVDSNSFFEKNGYEDVHGTGGRQMEKKLKWYDDNSTSITKASPNALPDRFDFSGWAYKNSEWNRRLQEEGGLFIKEVYEAEGKRVWEQLALQLEDGLEGAFDIDNPLIAEFIENYSFPFAQGINETTVGMLRGAMVTGMDEGLGMDGIAKLIREVFDNCTKYRSMLIARTETIRASNGAAKEAYRQSEVVESLQWLTTKDDRLCSFCLAMDGKVVGLDENYFELGDKLTVGEGANRATMKFDYEAVGYPPLHCNCRCSVIPMVYDEYALPKSIGLNIFFKAGTAASGNRGHSGRPGKVGGSGLGGGWDNIKDMVTSSALVADVEKAIEEGKTAKEFASSQFEKYKQDPGVFWHGTASGDLRGGPTGLHVGTYLAAEQALDATIGVPAEGFWDGTREYGKTLLAGQKRLLEIDPRAFNRTGHNADSDVPQENYLPGARKTRASFSNKEEIPLTAIPNIFPLKIVGQMTNSRNAPHSDSVANGLMRRSRNQGTGRSGFFYTNIGEDEGSISAVVPNVNHIKRLNDTKDFIAIYDYFKGQKKSIGLNIYFKEGNANSGNRGHSGRPGQVGGSGSGDGYVAGEGIDPVTKEKLTAKQNLFMKPTDKKDFWTIKNGEGIEVEVQGPLQDEQFPKLDIFMFEKNKKGIGFVSDKLAWLGEKGKFSHMGKADAFFERKNEGLNKI
jgi:SPP1 gp7 family putative phage head morphogenesis protein